MPGRPIVSCINSCTSPASRFVDFHLKQIFNTLSSTVLIDTCHFTRRLSSSVFPHSCSLVTADVVSLYTNMNLTGTIAAIDSFLLEVNHPLRLLIVELVQFVLENNYFLFQDTIYHQQFGMALGTPMAVNVANAFLYIHEKKSLALFPSTILLFLRFVDDLFLIIDKLALDDLKKSLYSELPDIQLTWSTSDEKCIFLDLEIFKSTQNNICNLMYKTYRKARNAYLYIPFKSNHPKSNFRSFIKAELLRYNRTNTRLSDILSVRKFFGFRLRLRGYPPHFLASVFNTIEALPTIPKEKSSPKSHPNSITFTTSYHNFFTHENVRGLLNSTFNMDASVFYCKTNLLF